MQSRIYDIVVLGASGFTGTRVCLHLAKVAPQLRWAIAGRSKSKMQALVVDKLVNSGMPSPNEIFEVDNFDEQGLRDILSKARLCMNCTGPYRFLGKPVVSAAIDSGCDYIDLCGEPEFIFRMKLDFHRKAEERGVFVLHACAFDSVPADLGVLFTAQQFLDEGGVCSTVDSFLALQCGPAGFKGHVTTYEAAVHGFGAQDDLRKCRAELKKKFPPPQVPKVGSQPKSPSSPYFEKDESIRAYAFKFPGADAAVVRMSQEALAASGSKLGLTPYYSAYFTVGSSFTAGLVAVFGAMFTILARTSLGRSLLLKHPEFFTKGLFTHSGPSEQQLSETSFVMSFIARGYKGITESGSLSSHTPDMIVKTSVSGPEPGYIATPIIFVEVASVLLEERGGLAYSGGVFTPGGVLWGTSLLQRLRSKGIQFLQVNSSCADS